MDESHANRSITVIFAEEPIEEVSLLVRFRAARVFGPLLGFDFNRLFFALAEDLDFDLVVFSVADHVDEILGVL